MSKKVMSTVFICDFYLRACVVAMSAVSIVNNVEWFLLPLIIIVIIIIIIIIIVVVVVFKD